MSIGTLSFLSIFTACFMVVVGFTAGFLLFTARNVKLKRRVLELENEMIMNHAEILKLLQGTKEQTPAAKASNAPVINLSLNTSRIQEK